MARFTPPPRTRSGQTRGASDIPRDQPTINGGVENALNHPTYNRPTAQLDSPNFGRVFNTRSTERQIQLGLKIHF